LASCTGQRRKKLPGGKEKPRRNEHVSSLSQVRGKGEKGQQGKGGKKGAMAVDVYSSEEEWKPEK